jgi:hypothetical protein
MLRPLIKARSMIGSRHWSPTKSYDFEDVDAGDKDDDDVKFDASLQWDMRKMKETAPYPKKNPKKLIKPHSKWRGGKWQKSLLY